MKGFINNGNNCYFNVSLKALLTVCENLDIECGSESSTFTLLFMRLLKAYRDPDVQHIDPLPLLHAFIENFPRFTVDDQHDVQECILCLIDILERDIPVFKRIFYGVRENQTIYPSGKNYRDEIFSMYILEYEKGKTFGELFNKSLKWNTIENYEDDNGQLHHLATVRQIIKTPPRVLMISFDSKSHIEVPEEFLGYKLIFSGIHHGVQYGGHYICAIKRDDKWYVNDDMNILKCESFPTLDGHYILIYIPETPEF